MTYDDIIDWSDENMPMELYDDFDTFVKDIEANFSRHGHFFPPSMVTTLADEWEERFDDEISETQVKQYELEAKIEQTKSPERRRNIFRGSSLSPKQKAEITNRQHLTGFSRGRRQRAKDMRADLARRFKRQDERIRQAKRQQKAPKRYQSKREKRRQRGKEKQRKQQRGKRK